jgi:hypothetical protein
MVDQRHSRLEDHSALPGSRRRSRNGEVAVLVDEAAFVERVPLPVLDE